MNATAPVCCTWRPRSSCYLRMFWPRSESRQGVISEWRRPSSVQRWLRLSNNDDLLEEKVATRLNFSDRHSKLAFLAFVFVFNMGLPFPVRVLAFPGNSHQYFSRNFSKVSIERLLIDAETVEQTSSSHTFLRAPLPGPPKQHITCSLDARYVSYSPLPGIYRPAQHEPTSSTRTVKCFSFDAVEFEVVCLGPTKQCPHRACGLTNQNCMN